MVAHTRASVSCTLAKRRESEERKSKPSRVRSEVGKNQQHTTPIGVAWRAQQGASTNGPPRNPRACLRRHGADRGGGAAATPGRGVSACDARSGTTARARASSLQPARLTASSRSLDPGRQAASGALVADSALEQRPHEQSSDGTPLPAWHLCWRRRGDRWVAIESGTGCSLSASTHYRKFCCNPTNSCNNCLTAIAASVQCR